MSWERVKLGDVCEIIAGQSPPSSTYNDDKKGLPFYQGKADFGDDYPQVRMWCSSPTKIAEANDILLSVRAPVGPTNICDTTSCIGRGLAAIRSNGNTDYKYVYYYFKCIEPVLSTKGSGSTFSAITIGDVRQLVIPLPPLPTQQKIAAILDKADELRKKDQQLLAHYDALLQSIFYDMFGDPVKNEKGWEVKKLGEFINTLVDVGSNGGNDWVSANINMKAEEDYAIMIRTVNLNNNDFTNNLKYVKKETYDLFKKSKVFGGEIIMNKIGSAGEYWIMPDLKRPVSLGLNQLMFTFKNLNKFYFFYFFKTNSGKSLIKSKLRGAVTKSITKAALREMDIFNPPIFLQNQFAAIAQNIQQQKQQVTQQQQQSEALFQGLLQRAFKGELVA